MGQRVKTVLGNRATRPISDFMLEISKVWYVGPNATGDGDDGRSGRSKETSLATWAKAITLATASKGDIIYLLPGHTETLATAAAVNLSKIGVRTINLGQGALAATFTFSAVDATITMTAASCSIEGYPIFKPSIDSVVSPLVISAADCKADIIIQDKTALIECVRAVLTTAAADRLDLNVIYRGFIAGDACDNAVRLVGVDTARINVDFYGVADVGIVEFHTTACHDIDIKGLFYNDGTSLTKNVIDSATGSTWSCQGWDGNSNASFSGGDNAGLATDDVTALATAVSVIDGLHDVPIADAVTNLYMRDVVGIKTDAAAADAVSNAESLMAYVKQAITLAIARDTAIGVVDGLHDVPVADAVTNLYMRDVVGIKTDAAAEDAVSATESLMAYVKQVITLAIARDTAIGVVDDLHDVPVADAVTNLYMRDVIGIKTDAAADGAVSAVESLMAYVKQSVTEGIARDGVIAAIPQCVVKADGAVLTGNDDLFVISGGPVRAKIVGVVTTVLVGAGNGDLQIVTTSPAATLDLNAAPVGVGADAAGTIYYNIGAGSAFTPAATLGGVLLDPVTVEETEFILTPGTVHFRSSAAQTGVIAWYISYVPLSPLSVVTAA